MKRIFGSILRLPIPEPSRKIKKNKPISRVLVFGKFPNPTFDYYFAARLAASGMPTYEVIDIKDFDKNTDAESAYVIIIRYASLKMARWIVKNKSLLSGAVVFVDDDIVEAIASPQASFRYRYRLLRYSVMPLRLLDGVIEDLWVSTEVLVQRLSYANPQLMAPAPDENGIRSILPRQSSKAASVSVAYHATAIHVEEHEFLVPILRSVLAARPTVHFEVVATGKSAALWRELNCERVTVRPPLPWSDYLKSQTKKIDIMLVPVTPSRLNDCRADTKRVDVARVGAAAIFSDCPAFTPSERGEIILPYDKSAWIDSLITLIDDLDARHSAAIATRQRVEKMANHAKLGISNIKDRAIFRI